MMALMLTLSTIGLFCGFFLMARVPLCANIRSDAPLPSQESIAIIIPARNEEHNLPRLLASIPRLPNLDVIVVDDGSTDRTAEIARAHLAEVVQPGTPPQGMTGKAWACSYGAGTTSAQHLFFLDADTFFNRDGLGKILHTYGTHSHNTVISILPYVVTQRLYEEFSLFFNLLMAFGAGGFGVFQPPRLFGQSLLIPHGLYEKIGGHSSVGRFVLENFHMSQGLYQAGGQSKCLGGKGVLSMRMFPEGLRQLCNGWTKAFADGAQSTDIRILLVSVFWLSSLISIPFFFFSPTLNHWLIAVLYFGAAAQVLFFARQIGTFRIWSCMLFPLPLAFFLVIFARSALRRAFGIGTSWRGRHV